MSHGRSGRSRGRRWGFRLAGLLLVLVVVELGSWALLRVAENPGDVTPADVVDGSSDDLGTGVEVPAWRQHEVLHPYLGFVTDPEASGAVTPELGPARFGFPENQNPRLFFEPSDERVVVAVLGGSVASIAATGGYSLERELARVGRFEDREIVVISLAAGGYKQPQQLMTLVYFLSLGAHFDIVLNLDGFNEVALSAVDLVPRQVYPFYPRDWDLRVGELNPSERRVVAQLGWQRDRRRGLATRFDSPALRWSHLARAVWKGLDRRLARQIGELEARLLEPQSGARDFVGHGPTWSPAAGEPAVEALARQWQRSSFQLHLLSRAQGIEYHHVLQPNQYVHPGEPRAAEVAAGTWREDQRYREVVELGYPWLRRLGGDLRAQGVQFHDLTGMFSDRREQLYRDDCCHLTFWGNVLLKRALAERLAGGSFERPENVGDRSLALEGFDPVAYFEGGEARRGDPRIEAEHDAIRYRFASEDHRRRFEAEPARFIPQFGGWDAYGMGVVDDDPERPPGPYPVDPERFEVREGRLYLFFRSRYFDSHTEWRKNPDLYIRRAEDRWSSARRK